jgi:hypothetical protein
MKRRKLFLLIIVLFTFSQISYAPDLSNEKIDEYRILMQIRLDEKRRQEELEKFLEAVAYSESRGNPKAYNRFGYIGKYQFGYLARKSCGFGNISFTDFMRNPSVWSEVEQDTAMIRLLTKNEQHLREIIHQYNGITIRGVEITKSGLLAAAHLAGAGGVMKYFEYGYNPTDAYGTGLEDYLIRFSGFNF